MTFEYRLLTVLDYILMERLAHILILAVLAISLMWLKAWLDQKKVVTIEVYEEYDREDK